MRTHPYCLYCAFRQAVKASSIATSDSARRLGAVLLSLLEIAKFSRTMDEPPAKLGTKVHEIVKLVTENPDPYEKVKEKSNELAREVARSIEVNGLMDAIELSIAGNVIDYVSLSVNTELKRRIFDAMSQGLFIDERNKLIDKLERINQNGEIIYLADNAGEIVFDEILIDFIKEEFDLRVILVVRGGPLVNDATLKDVEEIGMISKVDEVITTGKAMSGVLLDEVPSDLVKRMWKSDFIISKGQGNFESIEPLFGRGKVALLLRAKCSPVARELGVPLGSNVVKIV